MTEAQLKTDGFFNWNAPNLEGVESDRTPIPFDHTTDYLEEKIQKWHKDRDLISGSTDKDQLAKLIQEVGELSDHICKEESLVDDIGDILVVLINIAHRNNIQLVEALSHAYMDIKDRKGTMIGGVFVKE